MTKTWNHLSCALVFMLTACGATPPPKELVDARTAYQAARSGPAATLAPAQLHEAATALDRAELSFAEEPDSELTRSLAYIARRRAELADAQAATIAADRDLEQAIAELAELQGKTIAQMRGQLSRVKSDLAVAGEQLSTAEQRLAEEKKRLEEEKKKREEAERRAQEALQQLAVAAALAVKKEERGTVITLPGNVLFESGKSQLRGSAREKLGMVASTLKDQPDHNILIEGHTDSRGSESYNLGLSQRRADSVRTFLISQGLSSDRITAVGVGESRPVADNNNAEGRAQNRRVEIIVNQEEPK